jgi:hypothetical protein
LEPNIADAAPGNIKMIVHRHLEAVAVMPAAAVLDGADDLVVRDGEVGIALKILGGEGVEDSADGRHAWNPRMSASMRW